METPIKKTTKEQILSVTLEILASEGPDSITVRRIAEKSSVNIASINYYFGSKDILIGKAMELFGKKMKNIFPGLNNDSASPESRLRTFLEQFSLMLTTYPGFLKAQVRRLADGKTLEPKALKNMQFGKNHLCRLIKQLTGTDNDSEAEKLAFQLMAGIILPVVYGEFVNQIYNIDINDSSERSELIDISVNKLLKYRKGK